VLPAFPADSFYGKVRAVKSADVMILDYGKGQYVVRIIGVDVPKERPVASSARELVAKLVLGKNRARALRAGIRTKAGRGLWARTQRN